MHFKCVYGPSTDIELHALQMTVHASLKDVQLYLSKDANCPEWNPSVHSTKVSYISLESLN